MSPSCPSPAVLQALLAESLAAGEQARWTAHLDSCGECRAKLEALAAGDVVPEVRPGVSAPAVARNSRLAAVIRDLKTSVDATTIGNQPDIPISLDFLDPSDKPELLGRFGPYEITSLLGHGGMGIVLGGFDPSLRREVAIKVLIPYWAVHETARKRFLREARAAAAVVHEHVVAIHIVDEHRGLPYLVMPCIRGGSLQDLLDAQGTLPIGEIARIGTEIAEGLSAAHAKGLVHRDIKPANILLAEAGRSVRISDFGLAKSSDEVSVTRAGAIAGTPEYMAPEQVAEGPIDGRTDLFALGSLLYALACGSPPFRGDTAYSVIRQVCESTPRSLRELRPDIPEWLAAIIQRLLQKNPADRFATAAEVAQALRTRKSPEVPGSATGARRWILAAVAAASLALLAGGIAWNLRPGEGKRKETNVEPISRPPGRKPGFYLAGSAEPFASLADAIAAAGGDPVVEIEGSGPFVVAPLQLLEKGLTLRAAPGSIPVIASPAGTEMPNRSFLETDHDLTLEGVTLDWFSTERRPRDNDIEEVIPHTAIAMRGGTLKLRRCRITVAAGNCPVGLYGGSCQMDRSFLHSPSGPAVVVQMQGGKEAVIENSLLVGRTAIATWIDDTSTGGGTTTIRLARSTLSATFGIQAFATGSQAAESPTDATPRLRCEGNGCVLDATSFFVVRPPALPAGSPSRPLRQLGKLTNQTNWTGDRNVYSGVESFLMVHRMGRGPFRLASSFDDWRSRTSADSHSVAATVQFEASGNRRETADFALVAIPGLSAEEVADLGARVEEVGPGKQPGNSGSTGP